MIISSYINNMETSVVLFVFGTLITFIVGLISAQFSGVRSDLKELNISVKKLNIDVARVISYQSWHKEEIMEIKTRVALIEKDKQCAT